MDINLGEKKDTKYTEEELFKIMALNDEVGICPHCAHKTLELVPASAVDRADETFKCSTCNFQSTLHHLTEFTMVELQKQYHHELASKIAEAEENLEKLEWQYIIWTGGE